MSKNESPTYEVISGAAIAFAALLLIIPGFVTDFVGFLLIFPLSRRLIFNSLKKKYYKRSRKKDDLIDGEFEEIEEDNDRKL